MKSNEYAYLHDPRAISEIRKHKWLESQKAGREIGFATAALDWINRYGQSWKEAHVKAPRDHAFFLERRRFRRFKFDAVTDLMKNGVRCVAEVIDVSIFGALCRTREAFNFRDNVRMQLFLSGNRRFDLDCNAHAQRFLSLNNREYCVFFEFDEAGQNKIEQCISFLQGKR